MRKKVYPCDPKIFEETIVSKPNGYKVGIPTSAEDTDKTAKELPHQGLEYNNPEEDSFVIEDAFLSVIREEHLSTGLYDIAICKEHHKMSYRAIGRAFNLSKDTVSRNLKKFKETMKKHEEEFK